MYGELSPLRGLAPVRLHRSAGPLRPRRPTGPLAWAVPLRGFDWILESAVLGLGLLGVLLVWSASQAALVQAGADPHTYLKKQLLNLAIGLILSLAVGLLGREQLRALSPLGYAAALLCVTAVFSPLGTSVNGARAWIALPGGFQVEPSEYAKLGLALMASRILGATRQTYGRPRLRDIAAVLACAAPVIAAVAAEPALGVTVLLLVLLAGMIVLSGARLRLLAVLSGVSTAAAFAIWRMHLLRPYQLHRLAAFVDPSAAPAGVGYSALQAKIAIGSGGLLGQGLFHGRLIAGSFVPEQHTDFIFAVAGDELGFLGAVAIIILLGIVIARALIIAARAGDQFGLLLAGGIAIWFTVQSFINIGMTIGIMPVTGLPLPFVSYGGSAMFANMIAVGTLHAIHRRHPVFGGVGIRRS